jgi:ankyrin repeat protein
MNTWIEALKHNSIDEVKKLIQSGEDLNDENDSGESVLAYAIRSHCDFSLLMFLVENGADIYDHDNEGVSIFDMAITYNNLEMVHYFLSKDIDVNETIRRSGFTPLMCAACYGRNEIAKILLDKGADKEATDFKGFSAIDFARKMNKKSILKLFAYDENATKNIKYT